jgi:hypothetical protein
LIRFLVAKNIPALFRLESDKINECQCSIFPYI